MFDNIPTVLTSQEILDKAFHRASKIEVEDHVAKYRIKKTNAAKVQAVGDIVFETLMKYVRKFPSLDQLHPFHRELINILVDNDQLRKSLAACQWAAKECKKVCSQHHIKILKGYQVDYFNQQMTGAYGRVSSVVNQIAEELLYLNKARNIMRKIPSVDPTIPTLVIAGPPNVGKSQLISAITQAKPAVASYPFTTKGIHVGHIEMDREKFQVIDTPGLLDRDLETMNDIERQAVLALRYLSTLVVFMFDLSGGCGYPMTDQVGLYERVRKEFPDIPFLPVLAKSDLENLEGDEAVALVEKLAKAEKREVLRISTVSGEGVMELMELCAPKLREGFLPEESFT